MSIPVPFGRLVDDAALFPPGLSPLPEAVATHAEHLGSDHRDLVGPFVVGTAELGDLAGLAAPALFPSGLRVSVVVPTPGQVATTVQTVLEAPQLVLAGLEVKLDGDEAVTDHVDEIATAKRHGAPTYVEATRPGHPHWPDLIEAVARSGLRLKFRTGGTDAAAFPSDTEVATWIHDAVASSVPFKCTAGLHRAVRHTSAASGFEHHGYLNILLATARAVSGASAAEVEAVVAQRDGQALAEEAARSSDRVMASARAAFVSYGSCSILEPLQDLAELHLLTIDD